MQTHRPYQRRMQRYLLLSPLLVLVGLAILILALGWVALYVVLGAVGVFVLFLLGIEAARNLTRQR